MSTATVSPRPKSFTVIAVLALLWNLLGVVAFYMQVSTTPDAVAALPEARRQVHEALPGWIDIAFAVAVFGGVLGAIGLLMKKRWATTVFLVSLLALLAQIIGTYLLTPAWQALGPSGLVLPAVLLVIAIALYGYSSKAAARGWIA